MTQDEKTNIKIVWTPVSASPRRHAKLTLPPALKPHEVLLAVLFELGWIALMAFLFAVFVTSIKIFWTGGL